jgi:hypothetical protein
MWLEDGPLKILIPKPYFPFFLKNIHPAYDLTKLAEADQLSIMRFFVLHGIRPALKPGDTMRNRCFQEGFPVTDFGVAVMNYPEKTTNIILRPNGQTSFIIVDSFFKVMGLNQIIQTRLPVVASPNIIVIETGTGSRFIYFKETGFRRVQVAGLKYIIHVIDFWDPQRKQYQVVRPRGRPGFKEGIEEDPGPSCLFHFLSEILGWLKFGVCPRCGLVSDQVGVCHSCFNDQLRRDDILARQDFRTRLGMREGVEENPGPEEVDRFELVDRIEVLTSLGGASLELATAMLSRKLTPVEFMALSESMYHQHLFGVSA